MARKEEFGISKKDRHGFVPVMVVRSREEAEEYCQLFSDHDIPAKMGDDDSVESGLSAVGGIPVLVEREMLGEAKEIIADREDLEEFQVVDDDDDQDNEDDEDFHFVEDELSEIDEEKDLLCDDGDEDQKDS